MSSAMRDYCDTVAENFLLLSRQSEEIAKLAALLVKCIEGNNKILFCGNGGSAADAQHLAAELIGRYKKERPPINAMALTVDTSILTAVSNDIGYEYIFSRQVEALGEGNDLLFAISTSGNSANIIKAIEAAQKKNMIIVGLTGQDGGAMRHLCSHVIRVPSRETNHIQEMHIAIGHMLCERLEGNLF